MVEQKKGVAWSPQYKTEWNMQQYDICRMGLNLFAADDLMKLLLSYQGTKDDANRYYAVLWSLWEDIGSSTKLFDNQKDLVEWFNKNFSKAEKLRQTPGTHLSKDLIWTLVNIHHQIRHIKQTTGLGLIIHLKESVRVKLARAMGVTDYKG